MRVVITWHRSDVEEHKIESPPGCNDFPLYAVGGCETGIHGTVHSVALVWQVHDESMLGQDVPTDLS